MIFQNDLHQAMLAAGENLTPEELEILYEELDHSVGGNLNPPNRRNESAVQEKVRTVAGRDDLRQIMNQANQMTWDQINQ